MLLSGGIDSAALAALAAEESSEPLRTFSIGFEERSFDELADARLVAERYGTHHRELVLKPDAALLLPALADAFDEPFADSSALPTYLVSQLAAEDVKVALSGEGGDELFGGYYTYVADLLALRVGWAAGLARPVVERLPSSSARASFDYKAKRFVRAAHLPPLERHHAWKEIFSPEARAELTGREHGFDPVDLYRERFAETEDAELLARLQDVDLGIYLVDDLLVKTDRASMAHSLEARVPYLDPVVTNLALALPTRQRVRGFRKKVLLRKAVEPLLPRQIVRGKKRGFSIPAAAWLRGELEPFARETLSTETLRRQGFFRPEAVTQLLDRHVAGQEDLSRQLWGLLVVHALARAPRRARAGGPARAPPRGARPVSELPEFGLGYPGTELRQRLVEAVLAGDKTATAGLHGVFEDDPTPEVGDRFVVEDAQGVARAIVEVTEVRVIPASEIDLQFARDEGEGFESVQEWHEAHERFFERTIEPDTLISAVRFSVVERL